MPDAYTEKLDEILSLLRGLDLRVAALEQIAKGAPTSVPPPTTGLYGLVRPPIREVSRWPQDVDMGSPDVVEATERALHGVNWRGGALSEKAYDEAWEEIEALKAGDPKLLAVYGPAGANLDPEFAGFALLTGLIDPAKYDAATFGVAPSRRKSFEGKTIQSFLDEQFSVTGGPGIGG